MSDPGAFAVAGAEEQEGGEPPPRKELIVVPSAATKKAKWMALPASSRVTVRSPDGSIHMTPGSATRSASGV